MNNTECKPVAMHLAPIFPKLVASMLFDCDSGHFTEFEKLCYAAREKDPTGRVVSNRGGWQSRDDILGEPELANLQSFLGKGLERLIYDSYGIGEDYEIIIQNAWVNISSRGNYNMTHTHPLSVFSGVLYIKAKEGNGNIEFLNDDARDYECKLYPKEVQDKFSLYNMYFFKPQTGLMILFPSTTPHLVNENELDEDRISIAFNVWVNKL